jgi:hypothetical protein
MALQSFGIQTKNEVSDLGESIAGLAKALPESPG